MVYGRAASPKPPRRVRRTRPTWFRAAAAALPAVDLLAEEGLCDLFRVLARFLSRNLAIENGLTRLLQSLRDVRAARNLQVVPTEGKLEVLVFAEAADVWLLFGK